VSQVPKWETFDRRTKRPLPREYDRFTQALRRVLAVSKPELAEARDRARGVLEKGGGPATESNA
jgi:hypothetical protein